MPIIKAAVAHAFGQPLTVEDVHLSAPKLGEVEVTLEACAICHSDITYLDSGWGGSLPAVYGHEAAGRISALGEGIAGLSQGDPVVVTLIGPVVDVSPAASAAPLAAKHHIMETLDHSECLMAANYNKPWPVGHLPSA